MSASLFQEKMAALTAQCPPATRLPEALAAKLPINVLHVGTVGPAVLIIHGGVQGGLGGGPATFREQRPLAEKGWRLALVERPGFGESPSRGVDDMEADAVWIGELLGSGAHLVGHSWGGAEALLTAARRPDAVRSLVLIEPALHGLAMTDPQVQADPVARGALMKMGEMAMRSATPREYGLAFARGLGTSDGGGNISFLDALQHDDALATGLGCSLLQARMAPPPVLARAAAAVREAGIPVLVISGGWSPVFDVVCDTIARLTAGRHVTVASPNHFPQLANPAEFNAVLDRFLRDVETTHSDRDAADAGGKPSSAGLS